MNKTKNKETESLNVDICEQSDNSIADNATAIHQEEHPCNVEVQANSNASNTEEIDQIPVSADVTTDAPSPADDGPTSSTLVDDKGMQNHTADNNEGSGYNWSNKYPDTGDFYGSNKRRNFKIDGSAYNTHSYQRYRRFQDSSPYRIECVSWKDHRYNPIDPKGYKARWTKPNPSTNYSISKTQKSVNADESVDQVDNIGNKNKTDDKFTQNNVGSGVRNSPNTENRVPTKKRETPFLRERKQTNEKKYDNKRYSSERKERSRVARIRSPATSRRRNIYYPHSSTDTSKNLRKTQYQSERSKTKSVTAAQSTVNQPNFNNRNIPSKTLNKAHEPNVTDGNLPQQNHASTKSPISENNKINNDAINRSQRPKITLIPLAKLIRNELLDLTVNEITSSTAPETNLRNNHPSSPRKISDLSENNLRIYKPNLVPPRQRNISCCSNSSQTDSLVEKVVNMDKSSIKNVINSSGTKYDEALKIQARKRLREEIRKQLKSMNLEKPTSNTGNIESVADDIVNSIDLPPTVVDEIRKAFGIELFEGTEQEYILPDSNISAEPTATAPQTVKTVEARRFSTDLRTRIKEIEQLKSLTEKATPKELNRRIARFDDEDSSKAETSADSSKIIVIDSSSERSNPKRESRQKSEAVASNSKTETRNNRKKGKIKSKLSNRDVIVIESSESSDSSSSNSSSSSSSSSSSDDSDTDSTTSAQSNASSIRRRLQRQKIISENVVKSFETLILPNLSEAQRNRYKEKYSATTKIKLHFISCICTSEYNTQKFSKIETAKLQRNLKAEDNAAALEFLMREIVNVFNKQKKLRQEKEKLLQNSNEKEADKAEQTKKLMTSQSKSPTKSSGLTTATNKIEQPTNRISTSSLEPAEHKEVNKSKNANTAENTTSKGEPKEFLAKRQLESVNEHTSIKQGTKAVKNVADKAKVFTPQVIEIAKQKRKNAVIAGDKENPIRQVDVDEEDIEANAVNESHNLKNHSIESTQVGKQLENIFDVEEKSDHEPEQAESTRNIDRTHITSPTSQQAHQRQWRSPGEKKYINNNESIVTSATTTSNPNSPALLLEHKETKLKNKNSSGLENETTLAGFSNIAEALNSFTQQPHMMQSIDLDALRHNNLVGDSVVSNLRDIDVKLMELHKRKMFIEEMILKLQKEKMEADLQTIKFQNEKFILLNTAMTANATAAASAATSGTASASPTASMVEKPSSSTQEVFDMAENSKDCDTNTEAKRKISPTSSSNTKKRKEYTPRSTESARKNYDKNETDSSNRRKRDSSVPVKEAVSSTKRISTRSSNRKIAIETISEELPSTTTASSTKEVEDITIQSALSPTESSESHCSTEDSFTSTFDYSNVPNGNLEGIKKPITQILVFEESIIASGEDGYLYKFNIRSLALEKQFAKHSEAITQMKLCELKKVLYTTSLDGYLKKTSIENFDLDILTVYLEEPLQSVDVQWGIAFIGSRWGNIFTYDLTTNHLAESLLCSSDTSIIALIATKEGPRKILIISSKGNHIHFRDATSGLLLRSLSVPDNLHIFSLMLDFGSLYCGTQKNEIYKFDFTTGARLATMNCGNGAVSMKLYKGKFVFVGCYDGLVYVLDKETGCQIGRFPGSGKLVLALEIAGDKILTSAKDNTMQVIDIPKYIIAKAKV